MPFEFDEPNKTLLIARMEANLLGATAIAPQHVLLGLVHERAGLAKRLLSGLTIQQARELVAPGVTIQMKEKAEELPYAPEMEAAFAFARAEAQRDGSKPVGPEHLLLAILRDERVAKSLLPFGVTFDRVRAAIDARRLQQPVLTLADSPAPDLVLARDDEQIHPEFSGMLAELPHLRGSIDHAVIFTNASTEPITAIVARWTVVDPGGTIRKKDVVHDDYSHLRHNRVQLLGMPDDSIAPGARLIVTSKGFSKALDVTGPHGWAFVGPLNDRSLEDDAAEIRVSLDSVVYPDGRLVGPDQFGIGHYLHGRYTAAQDVVHRIDEAVAAGEDVSAVLGELAENSGTPELRWHRIFAASAMTRGPERRPRYVGWLESARNMPKPPELYRVGETTSG